MQDDQIRQQLQDVLKPLVKRYGKDEAVVICRTMIVTLFGSSNIIAINKEEAPPQFTTYGNSSLWHRKSR